MQARQLKLCAEQRAGARRADTRRCALQIKSNLRHALAPRRYYIWSKRGGYWRKYPSSINRDTVIRECAWPSPPSSVPHNRQSLCSHSAPLLPSSTTPHCPCPPQYGMRFLFPLLRCAPREWRSGGPRPAPLPDASPAASLCAPPGPPPPPPVPAAAANAPAPAAPAPDDPFPGSSDQRHTRPSSPPVRQKGAEGPASPAPKHCTDRTTSVCPPCSTMAGVQTDAPA